MIRKDINTRTPAGQHTAPTAPQRLTPEQLRQVAGGRDAGKGKSPQTN